MQLRMKNLNGPDDGLQISQNLIKKKIDEVEEDDDETIAILTELQGLKTRLKDNKSFYPANISALVQRCLLVDATSRRGTTSNQR